MRLAGRYGFELRSSAGGAVVASWEAQNLVVSAGLAQASAIITGLSTELFTYLALGTGTAAPASSDTALQTEVTTGGGERASATVSRVTTDTANDTVQLAYTFTFTTTGSIAITEAGIFNSSGSSGTMLSRATFSAYTVVSTNTLAATYKIDLDST